MSRVTVYAATGCHLCPPAIEAARAVCSERGLACDVIDIDGDVELERRYRERIPVVLVDDVEIGHHFVTAADLCVVLDRTGS